MSLTLSAEPAVIDGARSYAEHSGMTLEAFVLAYLETTAKRERERSRKFVKVYGYSSSDFESPRSRALSRVADENAPQWLNDISGIVSLPSGKSDDDLVCEAIAEKYGDVR